MFLLDPPHLKLHIGILVLLLNIVFPGLGSVVAGIVAKEIISMIIGVVIMVLYFIIPISCYMVIGIFNFLVRNNIAIIVAFPIMIGAFFVWLYSLIWVNFINFLNFFQGNYGIFESKRS
jgi:hypothetical protein